MAGNYMTIRDVAKYLKLPIETVYRYAREGRIPGAKVGRHWRFDREAIDRTIFARRAGDGERTIPFVPPREADGQENSTLDILIADPELATAKLLRSWVAGDGRRVAIQTNRMDAFRHVQRHPGGVVFLDLLLPSPDGVAFLEDLQTMGRMRPQVILITHRADSQLMDRALDFDIRYSLEKPLRRESVVRLVAMIEREIATSAGTNDAILPASGWGGEGEGVL